MNEPLPFRFPGLRDRMAIMGKTGSGKTQFGAWILANSPFDRQPYVIVDYKGDDLLGAIERVEQIGLQELPKHPGLYVVRPRPVDDDEAVEAWLRRVWARERIGLYFDEAYMLPTKGALQGILTQGRSKHIPSIILTQRPTRVPRFVFSEADFHAVFRLSDRRDISIAQEFMPEGWPDEFAKIAGVEWPEGRPPRYHSWWHDESEEIVSAMLPVPEADEILDMFRERLRPRRHIFK